MKQKPLDFSTGDPLLPLTAVANHAFRQSQKDLNVYQFTQRAGLGEPVGEILSDISDYFTARKIYSTGWTGLGTRGMLMTGGGTTEAYELVIRAIAEDVRKREKYTGDKMKPVIIMPVPTYGYFCENPVNWGIEVATFDRNMPAGGRVEPEKLLALIRSLHADGKRVVAYYDSNPNNPTGTIRTREETAALAKILKATSDHYSVQDREKRQAQKTSDWFNVKGLSSQVSLIDDMVYDGLEYAGQPQAYAFAQLGHEPESDFRGIFKHTFTLCGQSKAGLTSMRAGLVIANEEHIDTLRKIQLTTSYFPPKMTMHALQAWFSDKKPFAAWRSSHLQKTNALYRTNGLLMKALVNGIGNVPEASMQDKKDMIGLLCSAGEISPHKARRRLAAGIPGIKITTTPQAGFFHLLDLNGLKGLHYNNDLTQARRSAGTSEFKNGYSVWHVSAAAGIAFACGNWMRLPDNDLTVRVTFAKTPAEIIDFAGRLERMARGLTPAPAAKIPQPALS